MIPSSCKTDEESERGRDRKRRLGCCGSGCRADAISFRPMPLESRGYFLFQGRAPRLNSCHAAPHADRRPKKSRRLGLHVTPCTMLMLTALLGNELRESIFGVACPRTLKDRLLPWPNRWFSPLNSASARLAL